MWTPARGATSLVEEFGEDQAISLLSALVVGEVAAGELGSPPWPAVMGHIARADLSRFDFRRPNVTYWTRAWAARALAYAGDHGVAPWLVRALADDHWRVRMSAAQSIGRLCIGGVDDELLPLLEDPHPRVRAAAVTTLGRVGGADVVESLLALSGDEADLVAERLRVAIERLTGATAPNDR